MTKGTKQAAPATLHIEALRADLADAKKECEQLYVERKRLLAEREQLIQALRNCVNAQDVTGGPKGSTELACTEGARYLLRQIEGA